MELEPCAWCSGFQLVFSTKQVSLSLYVIFYRKRMVWDNEKDEYLCREVLLFEPYLHKPRTVARGNSWKEIAIQLTASPLSFKVDVRAVRERFGGLIEQFKAKNREEHVAKGVSPEQSQLDVA